MQALQPLRLILLDDAQLQRQRLWNDLDSLNIRGTTNPSTLLLLKPCMIYTTIPEYYHPDL